SDLPLWRGDDQRGSRRVLKEGCVRLELAAPGQNDAQGLESQPLGPPGTFQLRGHTQIEGMLPYGLASREHRIEVAADHMHRFQIEGAAEAAGLQGSSGSHLAI